MLVIRFARVGRRNQAFFHLVVAEKARAVQRKPLEKLGYYNPHTEKGKGEFVFDAEKVKAYIKNGAQMSQTAARLLVEAGVKEAGAFVEERATKLKKEVVKEESKTEEAEKPEASDDTPKEEKSEASSEEVKDEDTAEEKKEESDSSK